MNRRLFLASLAALPAVAAPESLDLFLLTGQSNMAGRGVVGPDDTKPLTKIWAFNKEMQWTPAVDPLHWDKPAIAGVGIGRSFASTVRAARPGAEVGLIPAAFGGSALDEWKPGAPHYQNAVTRAKSAMKNGTLRAILWHQGEADAGTPDKANSYRLRWTEMMTRMRKDLGAPDVPVVVGQLGEFFTRAPYVRTVNEQLAMLPASVAHTAFVPSFGLKHKGDDVHFDTPSIKEFGRRYAHAYLMLAPLR